MIGPGGAQIVSIRLTNNNLNLLFDRFLVLKIFSNSSFEPMKETVQETLVWLHEQSVIYSIDFENEAEMIQHHFIFVFLIVRFTMNK